MLISVITMLLNVVFNIAGYKAFGLIGPALVTLILTIGMTIALLHFGAKEIKTKVFDLFDFKEIAIIGLEIVVVGVFAYWLSTILTLKQIPYAIVLILCYGIYILILGLLNYKRALECYRKLNLYK